MRRALQWGDGPEAGCAREAKAPCPVGRSTKSDLAESAEKPSIIRSLGAGSKLPPSQARENVHFALPFHISERKLIPMSPATLDSTLPAVVLDTNVVFDWLVFRNPRLEALAAALTQRRLAWLATEAMQQEMAHTLARGLDPRWEVDELAWRAAWQDHARMLPAPVPPMTLPRCSDPDDQKFIELAVATGARWLLTRDRALLKLARRVRRLGPEIVTPETWATSWPE